MPLRRRRPVRRAAVTGAVGYAAYNKGKKSSEKAAQPEPSATPPPTTSQPAAAKPEANRLEVYEEIAKLGELKEKGLITDSEFEREKLRLLD